MNRKKMWITASTMMALAAVVGVAASRQDKYTLKLPDGLSFSDFMVQHADEAAIRTIQQHTTWTLENQDRDFFIQALINPPKPSRRLKSAARRYKDRVRGE